MKSRRTFTYFHSGSELMVRAPHTRLPRPSKKRRALIPSGFNTSCRALLMLISNFVRPYTTSFAGALRGALRRIEDLDPWVVERGVLAVELSSEAANLRHRAARPPIDYRDAVA